MKAARVQLTVLRIQRLDQECGERERERAADAAAFGSGVIWRVECSLCGRGAHCSRSAKEGAEDSCTPGSGKQRKELLVGSGSRGMRKAEGLAPASWRVAQKARELLKSELSLNLSSKRK